MDVFLPLLVILLLARMFGVGAGYLGQPASAGELLAGIAIAGVAALWGDGLPWIASLGGNEAVSAAAQCGIFAVVLLAGIELKPDEVLGHSRRSFLVALGGAVVPLGLGVALGLWLLPETPAKAAQTLLIGVSMAITAIPATVKVLEEFGGLHTPLGRTVVSAAVFDDLIGLVLLAVLTTVIETGNAPDAVDYVLILGKVALFFAVVVGLGVHVYPRVSRGLRTVQASALEFAALVVVALSYALAAELLGMHWILGVFAAGLFFEPQRVGPRAYSGVKLIVAALTGGVLGPIFFVSIGLDVDLGAITGAPMLLALVIAAAFFGKLVGAGVPAYWGGFSLRESTAIGVGMSARGAIELVIIGVAFEAGLFDQPSNGDPAVQYLYSILVLMAIVTTLIAPLSLRYLMRTGGSK